MKINQQVTILPIATPRTIGSYEMLGETVQVFEADPYAGLVGTFAGVARDAVGQRTQIVIFPGMTERRFERSRIATC